LNVGSAEYSEELFTYCSPTAHLQAVINHCHIHLCSDRCMDGKNGSLSPHPVADAECWL